MKNLALLTKPILLFLTVVALPLAAFADDAQSLVERDLGFLMKSNLQEFQVYQAVDSKTISTALSYVEAQKTSSNGPYGNGDYVFADPASALTSLSPLPSAWLLIQTTVPALTPYLDLTTQNPRDLMSDTTDALTALACPAIRALGLATSSAPTCRQIWLKAISDLKISMLRTTQPSAALDLCLNHVDDGFVLLDDTAINPAKIISLNQDLPAHPDINTENRLIAHELLEHSGNPQLAATIWPTISGTSLTPISAWARNEIYDCGKNLSELISEDGAVQIRTLSREVLVFSWAPRLNVTQKTGVLDGQDSDFLHYANSILGTYSSPAANDGDAMGPGFYAAIDPVASESYGTGDNGTDEPLLFQLPLPAGTRFLNFNRITPFGLSLSQIISAQGCGVNSLKGLFRSAGTPGCKTIRDQFVSEYAVSAIRYGFVATTYANCPNRLSDSFNIFDPSIINSGRMVGFTKDLPATPDIHSENRLIINQLFSLSLPTPTADPLWPSLQANAQTQMPVTNVPQWMTSNIMGCGNYPEDL